VATDESFLGRWSRLKRTEQSHANAPDPSQEATVTEPTSEPLTTDTATHPEIDSDREALTDADMPDIESLDQDSNFAQFLSEGVSDAIRQQALRKLFHLPEFNLRDGLNDYDGDFSQIPSMTAEVAKQIRNWVNEHQDELEEALPDSPAEEESDIRPNQAQPEDTQPQTANQSVDEDLGEADLMG